jgi:hypothetical protein
MSDGKLIEGSAVIRGAERENVKVWRECTIFYGGVNVAVAARIREWKYETRVFR